MRNFKLWIQVVLGSAAIYAFLRLYRLTLRIRLLGLEHVQPLYRQKLGVIHVFWHSRLLIAPFGYRGNGLNVLISQHRDGEMIARVMALFGFHLVRGSSRKGGKEALKEMVRLATTDHELAITPDGPRGPAEQMKPGAAQVAKMTGKPVVPFASACSWAAHTTSWDRMIIPLPFSRCVLIFGEPLHCAADEEVEQFTLRVEAGLRELTRRADELCGR
ncbi:MAG TPA: lysophospholipid acyltransferase family protein [Geobacterales bacterium]|nr:lysophospholipid acyltransferase family protein [Geobacterales bacterium]